MKRLVLIAPLLILLAGCGGSGGGGSPVSLPNPRTPRASVSSTIAARNRAHWDAFVRQDIDTVVGFYRDDYSDSDGGNVNDLRPALLAVSGQARWTQAAITDETFLQYNDASGAVSDQGDVLDTFTLGLTGVSPATGTGATGRVLVVFRWVYSAGVWKIGYAQRGPVQQVP